MISDDNGTLDSDTPDGGGSGADAGGIDFDKADTVAPRCDYATVFVATHKQPSVAACFSYDGQLLCSASLDNSIKLLDVPSMKKFGEVSGGGPTRPKPTLKSFYDHSDAVNGLAFHPSGRVLASCSSDCTARLFDVSATSKRSTLVLNDTVVLNCVDFHPGGDFLLACGASSTVRLFDVNTGSCYRTRDEGAQHTAPINALAWTRDGAQFATASDDGSVKIWDGVNLHCTATLGSAHRGSSVLSAHFSRSSRYLLTSSADGTSVIWDLAARRALVTMGTPLPSAPLVFGRAASPTASRGAVWSHDERAVLMPMLGTAQVRIYWSLTGALLHTIGGHNGLIICVASSPVESTIATTSHDNRVRFWLLGPVYSHDSVETHS
jgi:cleavage stimulation factor subunit 1